MQVLAMDKFRNRGKCKTIVIIEMILSVICLGVFVVLVATRYYQQDLEVAVPTATLSGALRILGYVSHIRVATNLLILILGYKIIRKACFLHPSETNLYLIGEGVGACRNWCRIELFRLILVVISIFLQLFLIRHLNIYRTYFDLLINMPALFGWLFGGDYLKELEIHLRDPSASNSANNNTNLYHFNTSSNNVTSCNDEQGQPSSRPNNRQLHHSPINQSHSTLYSTTNFP